ncbi:MAG: alpha/beta hydrolase [Methanomassiliicoccaceae archaeon]|nr:alpha/beta hydrolase [Methanomassiliicoccaceae archaeon]
MHIHVNGVDIHYISDGTGAPVLLLHGNGEDHRIFDRLIEDLKKNNKVFAVDTRGHGKSEKVDFFHYSDMVEDIVAFIRELGIERPILYGFSDGGIVGLMLAAKHPEVLSGLIASGVNLTPKDLKLSFRTVIRLKNAFKKDPLLELMLNEPLITDEDLERIEIPVLMTIGEKDIVPVSHAEHIAGKIPRGSMTVVPKEDHGSYIVHSEKLFPLISDFIESLASAFSSR